MHWASLLSSTKEVILLCCPRILPKEELAWFQQFVTPHGDYFCKSVLAPENHLVCWHPCGRIGIQFWFELGTNLWVIKLETSWLYSLRLLSISLFLGLNPLTMLHYSVLSCDIVWTFDCCSKWMDLAMNFLKTFSKFWKIVNPLRLYH
jgi:hypothetical protein